MGQGITVNIQAKIEGWQSQIKEISNALKNLKPGTSMSESLQKELTRVNGMVTNLGKNLNQRLTSDSAISSFTEKMRGVEEVFSSIGSRMANVSFADLDPSYITSNFKELVDQIETAKAALTAGETNSFQSLIGQSQELQAIFKEFKFDPTGMGIDQVKAGLKEIGTALEDNRASAEKQLEAEKAKVSQYQEQIGALKNSKLYTTDTSTLSQEALSGIRPVDKDKLNEYVNGITSALDIMGPKVEKKREEINQALQNLINANTTAEVRQRIDELRTAFEGTGQWKNLQLDQRQIEDLKNSFLAGVPSETEINAALTTIRENLVNGLNISDTGLLNKAIGSARDLIAKGDWDKLPDMLAKIIDQAKDKLNNQITLQGKDQAAAQQIVDQVQARVTEIRGQQTQLTNAQDLINSMLEPIRQENAELRQRVETLEQQLKSQATATTTGLGSKLGATSAQGMIEATQAAKQYTAQLDRVKSAEQMVGKIQGVVQRWFSVYAVIRMVRQAIQSMINTIKELDKTITNIAIVTDMDQDELWGQMPKYTQMARDYGASISGVYEVSQLYYQQGLQSAEVFDLTAATLKMARISGLDYADATDYMTNAVRSFKMEMSEANTVVDVYSAIAASSATSVTELATAMSKTASSAEAVGSSFENTTAMMAVMIEATRESPENIGSAMKSIISRYGELKENKTGIDEEGEAYSLNKVDTALQSVGITIHDTEGKFRDFDDVIAELANKWDTIDVNTQRYIATVMAGNRQQSRFLALVSSGARLVDLSEKAANSEDASQLQFLKSLDSVDTKVQQLQTSIQNLYTSSGLEKTYKGLIDFANRVVMTLNSIGNTQGIAGIGVKIATTFTALATLVTTIFKTIKTRMLITEQEITQLTQVEVAKRELAFLQSMNTQEMSEQERANHHAMIEERITRITAQENQKRLSDSLKTQTKMSKSTTGGMIATAAGLGLTTYAAQMGTSTESERRGKGALTALGGIASGVGVGLMVGGPAGWIMGALTLIPSLLEGINTVFETAEERAQRLSEELTNANNERIKAESEYKNMKSEVDELKELEAARYDSAEAMEAYIEASNKMAEKNPDIVGSYDAEGNAIIDLQKAYEKLAEARGTAAEAGGKSASKAIEVAEDAEAKKREIWISTILEGAEGQEVVLPSQNGNQIFNAAATYGVEQATAQVAASTDWNFTYENAKKQLASNNSELFQFLDAVNTNDRNELFNFFNTEGAIEQAQASIQQLLNSDEEKFKQFGNMAQQYLNIYAGIDTSKQEADLRKAEVATQSAKRTAIMEKTKNRVREMQDNEKYLNEAMPAYFDEFSGAQSIINTVIENALGDQKWDDFVTQGGYDKAFEEGQKLLNDYWTSLAPNIDEVEDLLKNRKTLTKEQFSQQLAGYMGIDDVNNLDERIVEALWPESTFDFAKAIQKRRNNTTLISSRRPGKTRREKTYLKDVFGETELQNLLALDSTIMKQVTSGTLRQADADDIMDNYISAAEGTSEEIQSLIFDTDIFSLTSIQSTIDKIKSQDNYETDKQAQEAVTKLQDIQNLIPLNLNTEANTLLDTFTEGLSDTETSIKNASKGMDFKTVQKEIERLGTDKYSINDFVFRDGKYYIKDYVKLANNLMNDAISQSGVNLLKDELKNIKTLSEEEQQQKLGISKTQWDTKFKEFKESGTDIDNFIDWYYADLMQNVTAGQEYIRDQFARQALESGDIESFLKLIYDVENTDQIQDYDTLVSAIISNNLEGLSDAQRAMLEQYSTLLTSTYKSIQTSIGTAMLKSLSGEEDYIEVTETNLEALKQNKFITNAKDLAIGGRAQIDTDAIRDSQGGFASWLVGIYTTESDQLKALQDYHEALYKNNPTENLDKLLDDETIAFNDLTEYFVSIGAAKPEDLANSSTLSGLLTKYGLVMTSTGDLLVENYENYINALTKDLQSETFTGLNQIERNEKIAKIETAKFAKEQNFKTAVDDLIKNQSTITAEQRANFANTLQLPYQTVEKYFTRNGDGTFRLNVSEIQALLEDKSKNLSQATQDYLSSQLTEITDSYMDSISNAVSLTTSGTTKQADQVAFLRQFEQLTGKTFELTKGFTYNDVLDAWTLNPEVLNNYIIAQAEQLVEQGLLKQSDIDKWINDQTNNLIRSEMDITSILDDSDTNAQRESASKLANSVRDYLALGNKVYANIPENVAVFKEELADLQLKEENATTAQEASEYQRRIEQLQKQLGELSTQQIMNILYDGGTAAVNVLTQLKGDQVTADEISAVYNAGINRLTAAEEALSSGAGTILTGIAAQIAIAADGIETQELPDGSVVITNVTSMVDAYACLYGAMSQDSASTTAQLNSLYAKMLTAADQKNIDALQTLENASGMTYDAFGELLASYGIKLEDAMRNASKYGITTDGFGKVIITNFQRFAKQMDWDIDSPEYAEAYNSYVDSLAELQNKPQEYMDTVVEQIQGISELQPGKVMNASAIEKMLGDALGTGDRGRGNLAIFLSKYGATLKNGLLQISDDTDVLGLISAISEKAAEAGTLLPEQLAELNDAILEYLQNIAGLINDGISGTLSNADANTLQQWATKQMGLNDLEFTQTSEGLKLSQKSAIELYHTLKDIDEIQAKIVFDELNDTLKETNEHYKGISDIAARIAWIEDEKHPERLSQYADELELAKEIYAVRSTTEDDSFNFMSNEIPGAQNNPINYYNNWADAISKLKTAMKTKVTNSTGTHKGLIDYSDWYNIVTELNNLAARTGKAVKVGKDIKGNAIELDGSMESAAELIQKGAQTLTADASGNIKVALGDIGINFSAGAGDMSKGIDEGLKEMAQSQIDMLDGLIAMLELIVKMQELGDLDIDDSGTIEFGELFKFDEKSKKIDYTTYADKYDEWREGLLDQLKLKEGDEGYNEDLQNAIRGIMIGDMSFEDILGLTASDLSKLDASAQQAYTAFVNAMVKAAESGDYNLDSIAESVKQVLAASGIGEDISITVGDTTLVINGGEITQIDWKNADTAKVLELYQKKTGQDRQELIKKIEEYNKGQFNYADLKWVLAVQNRVTLNDKGDVVSVKWNGNTYEGDQVYAAMYAQALEDAGIEADTIELDHKTATATGTLTIGSKEITVVSDEKGRHFISSDGVAGDFHSLEDLLQAEFEADVANTKAQTVEEYALARYNYSMKAVVNTKITDSTGKAIDLSKDPSTKTAIKNLYDTLDNEDLDKLIHQTTEGYEINLGDNAKITFNPEDILTNGKYDTEKIKAQLSQALGLDEGLAANITTGIVNAASTIAEEIVKAFSNIEGADEVAETLNAILTPLAAIAGTSLENINTSLSDFFGLGSNKETQEQTKQFLEEVQELAEEDSIDISIDATVADEGQTVLDQVQEQLADIRAGAVAHVSITSDNSNQKEQQPAEEQPPVTTSEPVNEKVYNKPDISIPSLSWLPDTMSAIWETAKKDYALYQEQKAAEEEFEKQYATYQREKESENLDVDTSTRNTKDTQEETWIPPTSQETIDERYEQSLKNQNNLPDVNYEPFEGISTDTKIADTINTAVQSDTEELNIADTIETPIENDTDELHINEILENKIKEDIEELNISDTFADKLKDDSTELSISEVVEDKFDLDNIDLSIEETMEDTTVDVTAVAEELDTSLIQNEELELDIKPDMDQSIAIMEQQVENFNEQAMSGEVQIDTSSAEENLNTLTDTVNTTFDSVEAIDNSNINISVNTSDVSTLNSELAAAYNQMQRMDSFVISPKVNGGMLKPSLMSTQAKGNIALAAGTQQTLMGELGPELVVTNGHYFVAGQNGAEFVDLPKDAIVFNHLQTASLLKNGKAGRGAVVTSEMNAVSMATGNMSGPAMASASAALAALKQLRDEWQALLNVSVKDLAGKGGGGGGGGSKNDAAARKAWIDQVERWYNLMQKIAQLEKDITHEETLRTKLNSDFNKNGKAYYESQKRSLQAIEQQMIAQEELNISREQYFKQRREQLNTENGPFNQLYEFDEQGQLKYKTKTGLVDDTGKEVSGYEFLSNLVATDDTGKPKYSAKEQYNLLQKAGFGAYMLYDSSGQEILKPTGKDGEAPTEDEMNSWYLSSTQAVWDRIESQKDEMQTLHDTIEEGQVNLLELENDRNELLEEIRNNQMEVENAVLDAIVDQRQRAIDDLTDQRNALEDSTNKFIQGLSDSLNQEKQMYENEQSSEELNKMRRQLAILQRSGGSGEQIRSLQSDIADQEKDMYFDQWQQQIDAIQAASDKELERLDQQIDIMTKTLEFEKDYGLLWEEVYRVMDGSPEEIASFITTENSKFWGSSPLKSQEELQSALFQAEQWTSFREDQNTKLDNIYGKTADSTTIAQAVYGADNSWNIFTTAMENLYGTQWKQMAQDYKDAFTTKMAQTGDITKATTDITGKDTLTSLGDKLVSALSTPASSGASGGSSSGGDSSGSGSGSRSSTTVVGGNNNTANKIGTAVKKFVNGVVDIADTVGSWINKHKTTGQLTAKQSAAARRGGGYTKGTNLPKTYDYGGIVEDDGQAYVHAKESVLTPEQTSILRNDILGNNSNSLMNLLLDFKDAYSGIGSAASSIATSNSEAIIIQNATVEMNIDQIANDYDAKRAGEKALEEMLRIASKTSAKNSIRR